MEEQRERAKKAQGAVSLTEELIYVETLNEIGPTVFLGYCETSSSDSLVRAIIKKWPEGQNQLQQVMKLNYSSIRLLFMPSQAGKIGGHRRHLK